ncbi:MAG: UbiA family prenyltransferase [Candidatus Methanoperedens sp.]|nr:UbiA family prenyltransferase [Candidatus Methanoperedens sp.]
MKERAGFIERHKKILTYVTIASYIIAIYLSFSNSLALFAVLFPQIIGIIYSIKISDFRLKDITGVKNIVVALSWAVVGTFLPLGNTRRNWVQILLIFYLFFTKLFINTVLFDVRDIEGDSANGVITIPVLLGIEKTRTLLLILNSTLIFWLVFSYLQGFFQKYLLIIIFAIFYGYWYILHFCREGIKIGKSLDLLVDGEWIPIAILALIFSRF